jgi:hypothetical protein
LIALAVLGGFLAASLFKDLKLKHIIVFIFSFIASSFLVGMMIYGHISQVFKYFIVNIELSYGNGVDMTLDIENYRFAFVCAFAILGCFITYGFFFDDIFCYHYS